MDYKCDKYPLYNLDTEDKEDLEKEDALQQAQRTLNRASKELAEVIKRQSHDAVAGGSGTGYCDHFTGFLFHRLDYRNWCCYSRNMEDFAQRVNTGNDVGIGGIYFALTQQLVIPLFTLLLGPYLAQCLGNIQVEEQLAYPE